MQGNEDTNQELFVFWFQRKSKSINDTAKEGEEEEEEEEEEEGSKEGEKEEKWSVRRKGKQDVKCVANCDQLSPTFQGSPKAL